MLQTLKTNALYILALLVVSAVFFLPALSGKKLNSSDAVSNHEIMKETIEYRKNGEEVYWTKSAFSGMPTYMIAAKSSNNFLGGFVHQFAFSSNNVLFSLFLAMLCTFLSLLCFGVNQRIAFFLSVIYGLNTWIIDSLVAGHVTKIVAFGFIVLFYSAYVNYIKKSKWIFLLVMGLSLSTSIVINHIQETYYGLIMTLITGFYLLYEAIKTKTMADFIKKHVFVILVVILAIASNISQLYILYDYSKDTMRGGKTELTAIKNDNSSTSKDGGLSIDYAFSWSYKFSELLNFVVPDAMGGSSNYSISAAKSELAKQSGYQEEKIDNIPLYWGKQPFTGAPNFIGVLVLFFFFFYLFYDHSKYRWVLLTLFLLSAAMGLGKHFMPFNEFLFQNLPMYNKFRTPTMAFSILNFVTILGAALGLHKFLNSEIEDIELKRILKKTVIAMGAVVIFFAFLIINEGYKGGNDGQILQQQANFPIKALEMDREAFFKSDLFRAIFIILLGAGLIWSYIKKWLSKEYIILAILFVSLIDIWSVSKRYYNNEAFTDVQNPEDLIPEEAYNQQLEQDKSHFRVFNTTINSFNDNYDGYKFSNVGGYSPAKLYRYQDLIDRQLGKGTQGVFDMLNTKYFIVNNNGAKIAQQNPGACGNAWFVNQVSFAKNADQEMDSLTTFNPKTTAWVDMRYQKETNFAGNTDPNATITLTKYHPDNMDYQSTSTSGGYAVFSEIWYRGNEDWKAYIDGKESKLVRTNYLLRGLYVPAGSHKVELKFKPEKLFTLMKISLFATIILGLSCLVFVWLLFKKKVTL